MRYRVHYVESERGWGQSYFHRDFESIEEAQKVMTDCNAKNTSFSAPNYYIQAQRIEIIGTQTKQQKD